MAVAARTARGFETAAAFDSVAADYHRTNTDNPLLRQMRDRTLAVLRQHVPPGASVLDLGCGPGTDHPQMAAAGYRVTGIDSAPAMVRAAQQRAAALPPDLRAQVLWRSIEDVGQFANGSFAAAFSNFGPLNCVDDLSVVAAHLRAVLRPGGVIVASVIGRLCPWELALFIARGEVRRALVRLRRGRVSVPLNGRQVWTRYYLPREFVAIFRRAGFVRVELRGLGVLTPPPYLDDFARRRPRLASRLLSIDGAIGSWPMVRQLGDHFVVVLRRG